MKYKLKYGSETFECDTPVPAKGCADTVTERMLHIAAEKDFMRRKEVSDHYYNYEKAIYFKEHKNVGSGIPEFLILEA